MPYIILAILLIGLIVWITKGIFSLLFHVLTLDFLPGALDMFDGNVASYTIPVIGPTIGIIVNYFIAAFINLVDFLVWFINWIPGLEKIIDIVYRSPDLVERALPIFGGLGGHRNFITHSILNPVFLVFLLTSLILIKVLFNTKIKNIIQPLLFIIGLTFVCHLLADTMPKAWLGTANIKIFLSKNFFTLPPVLSKVWLYLNAGLSLSALVYFTDIHNIGDAKEEVVTSSGS